MRSAGGDASRRVARRRCPPEGPLATCSLRATRGRHPSPPPAPTFVPAAPAAALQPMGCVRTNSAAATATTAWSRCGRRHRPAARATTRSSATRRGSDLAATVTTQRRLAGRDTIDGDAKRCARERRWQRPASTAGRCDTPWPQARAATRGRRHRRGDRL
jgi:hypothetical protein